MLHEQSAMLMLPRSGVAITVCDKGLCIGRAMSMLVDDDACYIASFGFFFVTIMCRD